MELSFRIQGFTKPNRSCYYKSEIESITTRCGCKIGSDHHLAVVSLKIKLVARKPFISTSRKIHVTKLRDPDRKQAFQIELQNRFESPFLQEKEEVRNFNGDGGEQV